jgi:hypothetical protein
VPLPLLPLPLPLPVSWWKAWPTIRHALFELIGVLVEGLSKFRKLVTAIQ